MNNYCPSKASQLINLERVSLNLFIFLSCLACFFLPLFCRDCCDTSPTDHLGGVTNAVFVLAKRVAPRPVPQMQRTL